jgi:hypothetical protein
MVQAGSPSCFARLEKYAKTTNNQRFKVMHHILKRTNCIITTILLYVLTSASIANAGVGESAVITLIFPPGARSTGMGEAFTGLAEDATATYYNPAGLGQTPQANSWKAHLTNTDQIFTSIAAKKEKSFIQKSRVWAGTNKGLLRFNGRTWDSHDAYLIEEDDDLESIAKKYLSTDDETLLKNAQWELKRFNKIEMKRYDAIREAVKRVVIQKNAQTADSIASAIARKILELGSFERTEGTIFPLFTSVTDSVNASKLSQNINENLLKITDKSFSDYTELKIPFSIAVKDSVTTLALDNADRIWVGTLNGLWRFDNEEWVRYTMLDGLPSNKITAIAVEEYGKLAVGTDKGLAQYESGQWTVFDSSKGAPNETIKAIAYGENNSIYIGTRIGMTKLTTSSTTLYDTATGLISNNVGALFVDSDKRLWIGCDNGISMFNGTVWKRYKFPDSKVSSFTEQDNGTIWIGTDHGVITYKDGKKIKNNDGSLTESAPEWKSFHSKNALEGNIVSGLTLHDEDIWIATDKAINQYDKADNQVFLFFEQLLPQLMIRDLWHAYGSFVFPTQDWGTIAALVNYIYMGENTLNDALGRERGKTKSWEGVFGLSWALPVKEDFSLGLNAKFVYSALAPGLGENGEGVGTTFAIDAALLKKNLFIKNFDLGFMLQNMGPTIFYVSREQRDPIPFTLRLGLVYGALQTPVHDVKFLFDMHKELVKNNYDGDPDNFIKAFSSDLFNDKEEDWLYEIQEINYNLGFEYWYANIIALRSGFLLDYIGERYEWTFGIGAKYMGLNFDWSYIVSPEGFLRKTLKSINSEKDGATGVRNGQWRASFLFQF